MTYRLNEPYNDLPPLPPPSSIETREVLRRCIAASRALSELKGAGQVIPNQAILINAIPLQEAKASSEIENIVTTQDALYRAAITEDGGKADPQTREVLRYRQALRHGFAMLHQGHRLDIDLMMDLCGILLNERAILRDEEPIVIKDSVSDRLVYIPPRGRDRIVRMLRNLEEFLAEKDRFDPLIQMAVAHYQFEAIHPFVDGNGRTGRMLNLLFLLKLDLLEIPVLYLSRYIIQHKTEYYRRLRAVTEAGDWEGWLLYMLTAIEETAQWTTGRIYAIRDLLEQTIERCKTDAAGAYSKELVELIFTYPYCKIAFVMEAGIAKRDAASSYLQSLEQAGILRSEKRGREVIYINQALLELLSS